MRMRAYAIVLISLATACSTETRGGSRTQPAPGIGIGGAPGSAGEPGGTAEPPLGGAAGLGAAGAAASTGASGTSAAAGSGDDVPAVDGGGMQHSDAGEPGGPDTGLNRGTFTALNYNVHGLPPLITGDDTPGRMRMISPFLNTFDVVGLQEDFEIANHDLLVMDSLHAYQDHYDDPLPNRLYGAGLTVLSVCEIVETYRLHYSTCFGELLGPGLTDCVASKGFQVTRIRLTTAAGGEIDLYNTHMDAGGGAEDKQSREVQLDELIEAMTGYSAGRAIVFVADTNASQSQLERLLDGAGLRDACEEAGCSEPGRIERTFVRNSDELILTVDAWRNEPAFGSLSDHPAVSAAIAWQMAEN